MKVVFVCHGNICRSPMAERVARAWAAREGVEASFTSAGVSDEEHGNPIDPRARWSLEGAGYDASGHRAHQITADEIRGADLVIAAERQHVQRMLRLVPDAQNLRLISDFDPFGRPGQGLPDPWYGGQEGFSDTLEVIERAMPALMDWIRQPAAKSDGH